MSQLLWREAARRPSRSAESPSFPLLVIVVSVVTLGFFFLLAALYLLAAAGYLPEPPIGPEFTT
jgi:hypothetical protein